MWIWFGMDYIKMCKIPSLGEHLGSSWMFCYTCSVVPSVHTSAQIVQWLEHPGCEYDSISHLCLRDVTLRCPLAAISFWDVNSAKASTQTNQSIKPSLHTKCDLPSSSARSMTNPCWWKLVKHHWFIFENKIQIILILYPVMNFSMTYFWGINFQNLK